MAGKEDMGKMSIRLEQEDKDALVKYAKENDLSVSQVLRRIIKDFLKDKE